MSKMGSKMLTQVVRHCSNQVKRQLINDTIKQSSPVPSASNILQYKLRQTEPFCLRKNVYNSRKYHSSAVSIASPEENEEFNKIFPDLVKELTDTDRHTDIRDIINWYTRILEYNVPHSKKRRGLGTVLSYKILENPQRLTPENIKLANIIGWCAEMLHGFFLMYDDVMDHSDKRHGATCWYKLEDVGLSVLNDATMLENSIYTILRRYFREQPCYIPLVELFHDVTLKTSIGQALDYHTSSAGKPNLELFSMDRYRTIVLYKTAYYSFQFPVALAMYLAGIHDAELHRQAESVLLEMGHLYHVQNDFFNCYAEEDPTGGELHSHIREGKCTWLAVVALQRATPQQREIMDKCYGSSEEDSIKAILNIYEELGLPNMYAMYVEKNYNHIHTHIQQMSAKLPKKLFYNFLEMINKRMK